MGCQYWFTWYNLGHLLHTYLLCYQEAELAYRQAIDLDPNFAKAYIERAVVYEKLGQLGDAAADYKKLTSLLPKKFDYFYHAGRLYYKLEKYDESLVMLNAGTKAGSCWKFETPSWTIPPSLSIINNNAFAPYLEAVSIIS